MTSLGGVALEQGDYERAEAHLKESFILLSRQPGEEWFLAQSMDMLATIAAGRRACTGRLRCYGRTRAPPCDPTTPPATNRVSPPLTRLWAKKASPQLGPREEP